MHDTHSARSVRFEHIAACAFAYVQPETFVTFDGCSLCISFRIFWHTYIIKPGESERAHSERDNASNLQKRFTIQRRIIYRVSLIIHKTLSGEHLLLNSANNRVVDVASNYSCLWSNRARRWRHISSYTRAHSNSVVLTRAECYHPPRIHSTQTPTTKPSNMCWCPTRQAVRMHVAQRLD